MTTIEKNIEIAEMLGWKKGMLGEFVKSDTKADKEGMVNIIPPFGLNFHSDANWQFEAIDFLEKQGYPVTICQEYCQIDTNSQPYNQIIGYEGKNKKDAIFEALFQFSQYLKQKK